MLVLSRARAIDVLSGVLVAPITSTIRGNTAEVLVGLNEGLKGPSAVKLDGIQTVPKEKLGRYLGSIAPNRRGELRRAVLFAMQLEDDVDFDA